MLTGIPSTLGDSYQLNTTSMIRHAATVFGEQEVVYRRSDGSWGRSDYAEEFRRMAQLAHGLSELGVGAGSMVGVLDWNSRRHFELYFAVPGLAATMLQLNLRLAPEDLAYVVSHSKSDWIFVDETLLPVAEKLAPKLDVKGWVVMTDKPASEIETSLDNVVFYEDLIKDKPETYDWPVVDEKTAAYAGYTTGTTGRPKGVYYSHRSIYLHTIGGLAALGATFNDTVMPITPMFHVLSWGFPQNAVAAGAKLVLPGKFAAEEFGAIARAFIEEKVTLANGAPAIFAPMLAMMKDMPRPPDLSGVRLVSGSSEPPLSMMRGFKEITGADVIHGYGATETTPLATTNWHIKPGLDMDEEERWDFKRFQGRRSSASRSRSSTPPVRSRRVTGSRWARSSCAARGSPSPTSSRGQLRAVPRRLVAFGRRRGHLPQRLPQAHRPPQGRHQVRWRVDLLDRHGERDPRLHERQGGRRHRRP